MPRFFYFRLFVCSVLILCLQSCATTQPKKAVLDYEKSDKDYLALKQTIENKLADSTTFDRILFTYPLTSFYQPTGDTEQAGKLLTENYMRAGNFDACLKTAEQILGANYTSLIGHYAAATCSGAKQDTENNRFHTWVLDSLIEAIWRTGNGQSENTPFVINSTTDLYAFIQLHDMVAVGQDLVYVQQIPVQRILIQMPESNRTTTWYFNVTPQFRRAVIDKLEW
ncbi:DUF4919 domain-containing protein [Glaciecola sp. XM2]|uniref:DUF4919 domain-containing protein n=1 Tax=Glaciecola sp. XM2 TaxID=1914931 RepID=UPI00203274A5|nr:DUF4919 domain-containing protein [Glaciecola sp. XM2]